MTRTEVFNLIDEERQHQDRKWGTVDHHPHEVGGWILLMQEYVDAARKDWCCTRGDGPALEKIRAVASLAVACLEQHMPGSVNKPLNEHDLRKSMAKAKSVRHVFDHGTRKCVNCGIAEIDALGRPNVCQESIDPTVRHVFDDSTGRCRVCGVRMSYILSRSSPTPCVPRCLKHIPDGYQPCTRGPGHDGPCAHPVEARICNLCNESLFPGELENHAACMARENHGD